MRITFSVLGMVLITACSGDNAGTSAVTAAAPPPAVIASERDDALLAAAAAEAPATLATLERLVNIETGTEDETGMAAMSSLLEQELQLRGFSVIRYPTTGARAGRASVGENIVGRLQGRGGRHLLLMAHMDTVYARGSLASAPFRVDGNRAYGPGIADAKSGIAVILHSITLLRQRNFTDFGTLTVLFNTDEEQGSSGSSALIERLAGESDAIFSFEPTGTSPEGLTYGTSGIGSVIATVTGRSAHAGVAPELGANALVAAADFVRRTVDLDQGPGKLRFNWTIARAGAVRNIVPDSATLEADVRYPTNESFNALVAEIARAASQPAVEGTKIDVVTDPGRPAFAADEASQVLIAGAIGIYNSLGHELPVAPIIGGGTDAAFAARSGKPVIEALGLPGYGYHTNDDEYVLVDAIPRRLYLAARMIMDVAQRR
ncbi:MAG TPA: glutamate carboxypeptidase [Povalibacter sp.]|uniref:glutamate carboxypeptidase n=1 Tax=Povalibacter sp. TaxID=1962978 RepID=UPI002CDF4FA0|nr:glutamate carboxypeptidase [Povalibacter sp.]HMN43815.1 glutamate carboxypeptidase [Povalibacter sp.]